eukprot:symbB.v1.2.039132.t1/scaffold6364.1/size18732/1
MERRRLQLSRSLLVWVELFTLACRFTGLSGALVGARMALESRPCTLAPATLDDSDSASRWGRRLWHQRRRRWDKLPCEFDRIRLHCEVLGVLADMRKCWDGQSYDLLRRNCAHFSIEFVRRLRVEKAPEWINALATAGGQMAQWFGVFHPVLVQEDQDLGDLEKVVQPSASELAEWRWAHEYIKERNAEARRVRQKSTLRAAAHLKHRRIRERRQVAGESQSHSGQKKPRADCLAQTCKRCTEMQLSDPLEKYGLSTVEFNKILGEYEDDPAVHEAVSTLMGSPPNGAAAASSSLTTSKLLDIHKFMLAEYERLASQPDKGSRDASIISFAAQAVVAGKTEAQYKISVEDIESAVLVHQGALSSSPEFSEINVKMQKAIAKLMGMPSSA